MYNFTHYLFIIFINLQLRTTSVKIRQYIMRNTLQKEFDIFKIQILLFIKLYIYIIIRVYC